MTEVLRDNFEATLPEIEKKLRSAAFVSIDTEFSGLLASNDFKYSLFDSSETRYSKQRDNISDVLLLQFGLTAFIFDREEGSYTSHSYCFYLFPHSFGSVDVRFKCQASSFEFLCHHKFDFNKFVYNGISFLNDGQEKEIRQELRSGQLFRMVERALSHEDEQSVQTVCSDVATWLVGGGLNEEAMFVEVPKSSQSSQCISYVIHHELRRRFAGIWTYPEEGKIRVSKVSFTERSDLEKTLTHEAEMQNDILASLLGFTRVFRLLVELRKPLIAHNCSLDLMIMYRQFVKPLPMSYKAFKDEIHILFPTVFDTKYMSGEFRQKVPKCDSWSSNALPGLYQFFTMGRGFLLVPFSPKVYSEDYTADSEQRFHDAGWDSFCAGICFIRMAHFFAALEQGRLTLGRYFTSTELVSFSSHLANHINIIRGNLSHFVLGGADPASRRPEIVVLKRRDGRSLGSLLDLTERFSKFGSVDVKLEGEKLALVAASTKGMVKDIFQEFYKHPEFVVLKYNRWRHDSFFRLQPGVDLQLWEHLLRSLYMGGSPYD